MRKQSGSTNCRQQVIIKEIQIRCHDCGISEYNIFCQPCFDENLHQDHQIQLLRDEFSGFCDCGDPNSIRAEGFCKSHSLKSIQMQSTNEEKQLLGKLKVLLEISSYNSIRLLEQRSMMPIIEADENVIQNSQYLKQIFQSEQNAYNAYQKMNAIAIYLTRYPPKSQIFKPQNNFSLIIYLLNHKYLPKPNFKSSEQVNIQSLSMAFDSPNNRKIQLQINTHLRYIYGSIQESSIQSK
ncbi:hypothetical protein pb186bvf_006440 [Paramecium bursaria]